MKREIDRRQEGSSRLEQTLEIADRLFQSGEWDHAESKYTLVMLGTGPNGQMSGYYERARIGKSKCLAARAITKEQEGNLADAAGLIRQALDLDPQNKSLAKQAETLREATTRDRDPFPGNAAVTSKLVEKTVEIKKLLVQADQYAETGQYKLAGHCLDDVRRIDPYNRAALKKLEDLENKRIQTAKQRYDASRAKALNEISESWFPPPPAEIVNKSAKAAGARKSSAGIILKKLADIKIEELTFNEKPIREAVQELQRLSELKDPEKKGVNFVLRLPPPTEGRDPESATVSFELRDITLQTALKYLCEQVRGGDKLRQEVEDDAIFLLPATETGVDLENRVFTIPPSLLSILPPESGTLQRDDPKKAGEIILKNIGVNTSLEGASAVCFRENSKLVVRNTPNELNKIEQRIRDAESEKAQRQFEVETKFLQFSDQEAKNLTFNLAMQTYQNNGIPQSGSYSPGTPGTLFIPGSAGGGTDGLRGTSGLNANGASIAALQNLLDPTFPGLASNQVGVNAQVLGRGFSAFVQLLQNCLGKDLVAAPRVTIADGGVSTIIIARQMFYPTSYNAPNIPQDDQGVGTGFIPPATPTGFESKDIGTTLIVKGSSTTIPNAVDLEFQKLSITDFTGFVNYGANVATVSQGAINNAGVITDFPVNVPVLSSPYLIPIFSSRALKDVSVRLLDGETVALGGLRSETEQLVDDKVPGLGDLPMVGRLFQSKASQKAKFNLIIFCTVRIIQPDGTLSYPEDENNREFAQAGSAEMTPTVP